MNIDQPFTGSHTCQNICFYWVQYTEYTMHGSPEAKTIVLLSWVYSWPRQLECQLVEKMGFIVRSWALELGLSWA